MGKLTAGAISLLSQNGRREGTILTHPPTQVQLTCYYSHFMFIPKQNSPSRPSNVFSKLLLWSSTQHLSWVSWPPNIIGFCPWKLHPLIVGVHSQLKIGLWPNLLHLIFWGWRGRAGGGVVLCTWATSWARSGGTEWDWFSTGASVVLTRILPSAERFPLCWRYGKVDYRPALSIGYWVGSISWNQPLRFSILTIEICNLFFNNLHLCFEA